MTEPEKKRGAATEFLEEQAPEEACLDRIDTAPSPPEGKASVILIEEIIGWATDTIDDGDGSYLEPPD